MAGSSQDLPMNSTKQSKPRIWLNVYRPSTKPGGRKTYAIKRQEEGRPVELVRLPEIEAINRDMAAGKLSPIDAERLVQDAKRKLSKRLGIEALNAKRPALASVHRELGERYLKLKTNPDADPSTKGSMEDVVWKLLTKLSAFNLHTVTADEIRQALAGEPAGSHRKLTSHVNGLMRMLGRSDVVIKPKRGDEGAVVAAIEESELIEKLKGVKDAHDRALAAALFYSGFRLAECLAVRPASLLENEKGLFVTVTFQMVKGKRKRLKNRAISRTTLVMEGGEKWVREWAELAASAPLRSWDKRLRRLGLPTARDLRHSYAQHGRSLGLDDQFMADAMGHSLYIHRRYYTGSDAKLRDLINLAPKRRA
jgi:integrase